MTQITSENTPCGIFGLVVDFYHLPYSCVISACLLFVACIRVGRQYTSRRHYLICKTVRVIDNFRMRRAMITIPKWILFSVLMRGEFPDYLYKMGRLTLESYPSDLGNISVSLIF